MPTANEALHDLDISHQIGLQRYSAATVRKIIGLLNRIDDDLQRQIEAMSWDDVQRESAKAERLRKMVEAIRVTLTEANKIAMKELRSDLIGLAGYEAEYQAGIVAQAAPEVGTLVQPTAEMLKAAVDSRPFQGRVLKEWGKDLDDASFKRVRDAIRIGYVEGESVPNIVKRIRGTRAAQYKDGVLEISRRGAEGLVRTAVAHTASAAKEEFFAANPDVIKGVRWTSVLDARTTPVCRARDGKIYPVGEGPRPPAHWRCRSTVVAALEGDMPAEETYGTWLKRQPVAVQEEALGVAKAKLFRAGGLKVEQFVDRAGNELTLDQLRTKEAAAFERAGLAA